MFHARGMRRVHAFDAYFMNSRRKYSGEIWATKNDRLLLRFHCPTESDYDEAFELHGVTAAEIDRTTIEPVEGEADDVWPAWTPPCVREMWERWLSSVS
ncbi:MAG TPA: hypothetical protein PK867_28830 [Pirellulales bacterium]|nr:hypothetical protein [Pirellulales bacterium]